MFGLVIATALATASPTPVSTLPKYVALDYNKPGRHPPLTASETARIRQVLEQVEPCQRPLVRYAFDSSSKEGVSLFFNQDPDAKGSTQFAHVFGQPNLYYLSIAGLIAGPPDALSNSDLEGQRSIQWDISRQPCPK